LAPAGRCGIRCAEDRDGWNADRDGWGEDDGWGTDLILMCITWNILLGRYLQYYLFIVERNRPRSRFPSTCSEDARRSYTSVMDVCMVVGGDGEAAN